jgi:hypothetical protein
MKIEWILAYELLPHVSEDRVLDEVIKKTETVVTKKCLSKVELILERAYPFWTEIKFDELNL